MRWKYSLVLSMSTWLLIAALVATHDDEIERQADRQVRADRRVHRNERAFRGFTQRHAAADHAVDDRLAVLRLADLEIRGVGRGLDEVAGGVDMEEPGLTRP